MKGRGPRSSEKDAFMLTLSGVAIASDAFFPFRDSIDVASRHGVQ
jgi:phosphoribosylaminoimidazolecarboxamide formyltransferase/IMP cyclohydrolase